MDHRVPAQAHQTGTVFKLNYGIAQAKLLKFVSRFFQWSGQVEKAQADDSDVSKDFDPGNPLCPGATRPNGVVNPEYTSTFVFANDFPALLEESPEPALEDDDPLFRQASARGTCKVVCFHPRSSVTIPLMTDSEVIAVIDTFVQESLDLGQRFSWVQIFENKGAIMGCSNPHPHSQVWASEFLPNEAFIKDANFKQYFAEKGSPMLLDYAKKECLKRERIVCENNTWVAVVPFWATWPFEILLMPKEKHILRLQDLDANDRATLADLMKQITTKYDNLFETSFPYSMGFHGAPTGKFLREDMSHWQLHALYFPPLLRSATVKKHMVGYELLANAQRDLTPEQAAQRLREMPLQHYVIAKAAN